MQLTMMNGKRIVFNRQRRNQRILLLAAMGKRGLVLGESGEIQAAECCESLSQLRQIKLTSAHEDFGSFNILCSVATENACKL